MDCVPAQSMLTSADCSEWPRSFSTGSKSQTVLPFSTDTAGRDGAGGGQQALGQRGLAGGAVADQGNGTNVGTCGLGHDNLVFVVWP
jgi:hypothetical protein